MRPLLRPVVLALAGTASLVAGGLSVLADRGDIVPIAVAGCAAPAGLMTVGPALRRAAGRIRQRQPLRIIAVGSSSTLGVGASDPQLSYPSRLEAELRERFPGRDIRVVNRGRSGEDAPEEAIRLERDVIAEHPDLVIWQVGTNALLRRDDFTTDDASIRAGIARLRSGGSEVVLMDLQFAPRVIGRPAHMAMERLIAAAAEETGVGLFRRFEIMHSWQEEQAADGAPMIGADGLHMTDRGYECLAVDLAEALADNWRLDDGLAARAPTGAAPPFGAAALAAMPAP